MLGLFRERMARGGWKHDMAFPAPVLKKGVVQNRVCRHWKRPQEEAKKIKELRSVWVTEIPLGTRRSSGVVR
jgi:hypothetical protein